MSHHLIISLCPCPLLRNSTGAAMREVPGCRRFVANCSSMNWKHGGCHERVDRGIYARPSCLRTLTAMLDRSATPTFTGDVPGSQRVCSRSVAVPSTASTVRPQPDQENVAPPVAARVCDFPGCFEVDSLNRVTVPQIAANANLLETTSHLCKSHRCRYCYLCGLRERRGILKREGPEFRGLAAIWGKELGLDGVINPPDWQWALCGKCYRVNRCGSKNQGESGPLRLQRGVPLFGLTPNRDLSMQRPPLASPSPGAKRPCFGFTTPQQQRPTANTTPDTTQCKDQVRAALQSAERIIVGLQADLKALRQQNQDLITHITITV